MGAIIDGLGLGVSSGIGLTLVRGVPEATGIRTAALAKKCKVNLEEANTDGELLPPQRCISKTQVCVYEDTNNSIVGAGSSGCDNLIASSFCKSTATDVVGITLISMASAGYH